MGELFRRFEFRALLRRIDELEAAVPGAVVEREEHAVGAERGDAGGARARCSRDGGPIGLAGDGAGLLGVARGEQALLIDESAATPALAAGAEPARRAQLQAVRRRARPRPASCPPSTPSWPRT